MGGRLLNRDPERLQRLRAAVRYLLQRDGLRHGHQSRLAEHFHVSRQRVHQVVKEERERGRPVPAPDQPRPLVLSPLGSVRTREFA
jgi:hypothetical protein